MSTFEKGDVVQVRYSSPKLIEEWMSGMRKVGPGDVGVVKFSTYQQQEGWKWVGNVTITFPMIGTFAIHSSNLVLIQKAAQDEIQAG